MTSSTFVHTYPYGNSLKMDLHVQAFEMSIKYELTNGHWLPLVPDWPVLMQIRTPSSQFDWFKKSAVLIGWDGAALVGW